MACRSSRQPHAIIEKLNAALNTVLASQDVRARLAIEGAEPLPSTPAEYGADIDREETQWSKVVKASGARRSSSTAQKTERNRTQQLWAPDSIAARH